jgi:hypothetical protein
MPGENQFPGFFNAARRMKQEAEAIVVRRGCFARALGRWKPALIVIFGGQDCLFCLPRGIPPGFRHETR